jgi:hypothetical protein
MRGSRVCHFIATFDDVIIMNSTLYLEELTKGVHMLYYLETTTFSHLPHICSYCLMLFHAKFMHIISPHMHISNVLVRCYQSVN